MTQPRSNILQHARRFARAVLPTLLRETIAVATDIIGERSPRAAQQFGLLASVAASALPDPYRSALMTPRADPRQERLALPAVPATPADTTESRPDTAEPRQRGNLRRGGGK